jgi:hypothetical protein
MCMLDRLHEVSTLVALDVLPGEPRPPGQHLPDCETWVVAAKTGGWSSSPAATCPGSLHQVLKVMYELKLGLRLRERCF